MTRPDPSSTVKFRARTWNIFPPQRIANKKKGCISPLHATVSKQIHKETDSSMLDHFTREIKNTYQLWKFVNIRCSGDPVRNYGALSFFLSNDCNHIQSFYHPATSLLFILKTLFIRVRKLAFWVAFAHPVMPVTVCHCNRRILQYLRLKINRLIDR